MMRLTFLCGVDASWFGPKLAEVRTGDTVAVFGCGPVGVPHLIDLVRSGVVDPVKVLTKVEPLTNAIHAYKAFDEREARWVKTELLPAAAE